MEVFGVTNWQNVENTYNFKILKGAKCIGSWLKKSLMQSRKQYIFVEELSVEVSLLPSPFLRKVKALQIVWGDPQIAS